MCPSIYTTAQITDCPRGVCTGDIGEPPFGVQASGPSSQSLRSSEVPTFYSILYWAPVSTGTEKQGRSEADGMPGTHQTCLPKAKPLTWVDLLCDACRALLCRWFPARPAPSFMCMGVDGVCTVEMLPWRWASVFSSTGKFFLFPQTQVREEERQWGGGRGVGTLHPVKLGFNQLPPFGCLVSLGQSLKVCFLIS